MTRALRLAALFGFLFLASAWAREVPITILDTTDVHGRIVPERAREAGCLARCATLIREARASGKNVLLVDAGDTIQGSAASWLSGGLVMVKALNALRYDAWVLGNHEFDWGLDKVTNCIAHAEMPVLAANASGLASVKPYVIREVDGVKVAIVGLTTPGIPNWSRPRLIPGLKFADSVETLRWVLPLARKDGANVTVLVVHQGYKESGDDHANQLRAITQKFPELDVIIGGHTHREFIGAPIRGILYQQAGYHGSFLGRVDVVFDTDKRKITSFRANVIPVKENVAMDEALVALTRDEVASAEKYLGTRIGEATEDFTVHGAPKSETAIRDLICRGIVESLERRGVKTDAVVHGGFSEHEMLKKGPLSIGDVWRIVPYENTVGVVRLTRDELREVLDEDAGGYEKREFRGVWGLRCRLNPRAEDGHRVLDLQRADGSAIAAHERLTVALNSYDLAGGGLRWKKLRSLVQRNDAGLVEYDIYTRDAVVDFIRRHGQVTPSVQPWWRVTVLH